MTKAVRIENADNSTNASLQAIAQIKNASGEWTNAPGAPTPLAYPTVQVTLFVHSGQRLIIEEVAS